MPATRSVPLENRSAPTKAHPRDGTADPFLQTTPGRQPVGFMEKLKEAAETTGLVAQARNRAATRKVTIAENPDNRVQIEVWADDELEFRALSKGGIREGMGMVETFLSQGPDGFIPKLRGASYDDIAEGLSRLAIGDRFTSHRLTDLVYQDGVHDRALVLKNCSSALTKLRKREVPWLHPAGKQGKSMLYELTEIPTVAEAVGDLQD